MPKPQTVIVGTPYTDQMYSAVDLNWQNIHPRPDKGRDGRRWLGGIGSYLPEAHNRIVQDFLEKTDCDRLLILEDDIAVHSSIIARCRTHRADVVTGIYFARRPPYNPLIYEAVDDVTGACNLMQPDKLASLLEQGKDGREVPISSCGSGILSIHRRVVERLDWPWFEPSPADYQNRGFGGHDFMFCQKVRLAGFSICWDTSELMYGYHVGWQHYTAEDYISRAQQDALSLR